jgi:hypothetical protein
MVTRQSGNKNDTPNLGLHVNFEEAVGHFDGIIKDRRGSRKPYKCNIVWISDHKPSNNDFDKYRFCIKEAYIEHPRTEYQEKYVEMLQIERWYLSEKEIFIEKL